VAAEAIWDLLTLHIKVNWSQKCGPRGRATIAPARAALSELLGA
jgi:hypothetical protein